MLCVREGDDVVAVALPEAYGHGDVAEREPPGAVEQHEVN